MTTTGTCYFANTDAAIRYYRAYENNPKRAVALKLKEGSIKLGFPPLKSGQKAVLNCEEGRYFIVDCEPDADFGRMEHDDKGDN